MPDVCLTLICPPEVEEHILDLLLMSSGVSVFTSASVAAHGLALGHLNQTEQVLGRASALQIQALVSHADKTRVLGAIQSKFKGAGVRYWVTPIAEAGEIK